MSRKKGKKTNLKLIHFLRISKLSKSENNNVNNNATDSLLKNDK